MNIVVILDIVEIVHTKQCVNIVDWSGFVFGV
jgi:hypothetical protein